jgi:plasmid stabilization system protein ParE
MSAYVVAPAAQDDLLDLWHYYAREVGDPALADRIAGQIVTGFRSLAKTPGMGHLRKDLSDDELRFWKVRTYLIIYRSIKSQIEIVRVLHSARDVRTLLG